MNPRRRDEGMAANVGAVLEALERGYLNVLRGAVLSTQTAQEFMDDIGYRMRKTRRRLGLSQAEVAKALGCSDSTYSEYERGITMMNAHTQRSMEQYFNRMKTNRTLPAKVTA
jgi:ribosome-binding protein aMBF1 (putative translation factor)